MFIIDFRNKKVSQYGFSVVNNNDVDIVHIYSHFVQYKDYLVYLKVESEDKSYVDEILIDSENISVEEGALLVKWTMGAISTQCKKIYIQLEFREGNEEDSKVAQTNIVSITLGDTIDTSEGAKHLYPQILKELQRQIDELKVGSVSDFDLDYTNDVLTITLFNEEGEALAQLQANIPTSTKVDKIAGKGLSTNDFTDALLNKLNSIAQGAQVNVLEGVQVDGNDLPIDANKKVNIANKVTKTDNADKVYGTDGSGNQTTLPVDNVEGKDGNIARRKQTSGQVSVPTTPVANDDATSKQYVDAFGKTIELTVDPTTYVLTAKLKDANGNVLATQTVDLPLESVVVGGSYDAQTQSIILTLQNGSTITIPVAGLISGLVSQADFDALALRVTTAEGNIVTLGNTKVNYNDINVSGGFVISLTKNGSTYPIAEVVNVSATPVVVQHTSDLPAQNDGNLYVVLDNGYLYAWSNGWQQLYEYTSDLLTITEVTAGEVIYSYISDKGHSNRPIQVESAVRDGEGNIINETYAKKIGYEPRLSVGSADNINSDRQIDDPEASCPPTTMGITGGEAEIKTGIENFEYMEGKSKKFNQLVQNGDFAQGSTEWHYNDGSLTVANKVATFVQNNGAGRLQQYPFKTIQNHKYLGMATVTVDVADDITIEFSRGWVKITVHVNANERTTIAGIVQLTNGEDNSNIYQIFGTTPNGAETIMIENFQLFDLTAIYGAGNEPTNVEQFKADYPLDYYAYNAGEILSAKASKLISRGRQQWDEEWENGGIYSANGELYDTPNLIRSKDFSPCIGGQAYHLGIYDSSNANVFIFWYDANKNYIGFNNGRNAVRTAPANASFFKLNIEASYGNTYHNDITISVYFEDGEGYDKYYAYSAQEVTLPNIELRSVGDIKDIAYAVGGGKRRIKKYTFTGNESFTQYGTTWVTAIPAKGDLDNTHILSNVKYKVAYANSSGNDIELQNVDLTTLAEVQAYMAGKVVCYVLDEEQELTENEGWVEQVLVDNYGTLQFVTDPQQVPQVEQPYFIRYTIDLKEFLDGTYTHAQGDPQNLALKEDVENLKENIENGNTVAGHSEVADNLTPYDDESGTPQTIPFINQGTGCGNGEQVVDTGSIAQLKNKLGNTIVVNQKIKNFGFADGTVSPWIVYSGTGSVSNGVLTITNATGRDGLRYPRDTDSLLVRNHKYLLSLTYWGNTTTFEMSVFDQTVVCKTIPPATAPTTLSYIVTPTSENYDHINLDIFPFGSGVVDSINLKNVFMVDLTQMFGSNDNIPAYLLAHPEAFFNYYQGSLAYNAGAIVNANGQFLKCIGRNVWDEVWEVGTISTSTGENVDSSTKIRSKNFIPCSPNTSYYFYSTTATGDYVYWYDANKNFIRCKWIGTSNTVETSPSNACYMKIINTGTSYQNNVCVSRYYEGESGYDQYYPYTVLTNVDTGDEVLRSAGNVRDSKAPNGVITRRVGVVDLGELNWTYVSANNYYTSNDLRGLAVGALRDGVDIANINCSSAVPTYVDAVYLGGYGIGIQGNGTIYFKNASTTSTTKPSGTLYYELVEEVEEQGTPYNPNLIIDDFGSMEWDSGEYVFNGVPQGSEIFYPVDYKASIDSLLKMCGGDLTTLVLKGALASGDPQTLKALLDYVNGLHAIEQVNAGGALRHQLADKANIDFNATKVVDLGDLNWAFTTDGNIKRFLVVINDIEPVTSTSSIPNLICSKYQSASWNTVYGNTEDKVIGCTSTTIGVYDSNYSDATAFKNAMKGILLAYKKAS